MKAFFMQFSQLKTVQLVPSLINEIFRQLFFKTNIGSELKVVLYIYKSVAPEKVSPNLVKNTPPEVVNLAVKVDIFLIK